MSSEGEFKFTWVIENFHMCSYENGEYIRSLSFSTRSFRNIEWYLKLYPKGENKTVEKFISCFLHRSIGDSDHYSDIEVDYEMSLNSFSRRGKKCFIKGSTKGYGYSDLFKRSVDDFCDNICVIEFRIFACVEKTTNVKEENLDFTSLPSFCESDLKTFQESLAPEVHKELLTATEKIFLGLWKNIWPYPKQYFARTRISMERRSVTLPIKNIASLQSEEKFHLPVLSCYKYPPLLIILYKILDAEVENLGVKICFINKLTENLLVICKMQILHSEIKNFNKVEKSHLYRTSENRKIWNLENDYQWSEIKKYRNASLNFEFSISNGSFTSDTDLHVNMNIPTILSEKIPSVLFNNLFQLYTEQRFCDVTLRTSKESFKVHKSVLCAMSPVFATMFDSRMKESSTNDVLIDDLDSDTVSQMLNFMYTERVEQLQFDSALKLFAAADKYEIELLKQTCRVFLMKNLSCENICSMLSLADAHQDQELKDSAAFFLSIYRNSVFPTQQWQCLVDCNPRLVSEILQNILTKYY